MYRSQTSMHASRNGFTLLEIIIALGITAVIVLAIGKFSNSISNIGVVINSSLQSNQDLTLAFRTVTTDIRSMGPGSNGAYPIDSVSSSSLTFYSDIDQDGVFEKVRYYITTSTFQKTVTEPTGNPLAYATSSAVTTIIIPALIVSTSSPTFTYFDSSYTGGATGTLSGTIISSDIRVVTVRLTADTSTSTAPRPVTFTNTITIRNLRSN